MRYLKLCCLVCLVITAGCATVPSVSTRGGESLADLCRQAGVSYSYDPVTRSAQLVKGDKTVSVVAGSNEVWIGKEKISLAEPASLSGEGMMVSPDFKERVLCRLAKGVCFSRGGGARLKIMIDPGHGGKDPGAVGYRIQEKEVVLDIARRLEQILRRDGHDVRMTRSGDQFISLEERTEMAAQWGTDFFVSIHANASESNRARGFEVWAPRSLTHEDFAEPQRRKNHQIAFKQMNMKKNHRALEKTLEDMFYRYKSDQSLKFASAVSRHCVRDVSASNRGVKQSGFFVLRNTLIPSILVEVGFISNSRDAEQLRSSAYRQQMADMLAAGIRHYIQSF